MLPEQRRGEFTDGIGFLSHFDKPRSKGGAGVYKLQSALNSAFKDEFQDEVGNLKGRLFEYSPRQRRVMGEVSELERDAWILKIERRREQDASQV